MKDMIILALDEGSDNVIPKQILVGGRPPVCCPRELGCQVARHPSERYTLLWNVIQSSSDQSEIPIGKAMQMNIIFLTLLVLVVLFLLGGLFCRFKLGWSWKKYSSEIFDYIMPF